MPAPNVEVAVTAPTVDTWLGSARPGICGVTEEGSEGTCHLGERGSFGGALLWRLLKSPNQTEAALACLQRCARCKRCRFVTLKTGHRPDCSWYSSCDLKRLQRDPAGFFSGAVPWQTAELATNTPTPSWLSRCPRNAATCGRRALPGQIPAAGGCSNVADFQSSYALTIHQARLRQWATCNAEANRRASHGATILGSQVDVEDFARYTDGRLLANLPLDARLLDRRSARDALCLTPACLARQLAGRWLVFFGDSTTRMHQSALVALVASRCNASVQRFGPMLRGRGVAGGVLGDNGQKGQCDFDSWITFPEAETESPEQARSPPASQKRALLVSNHFLRGLDLHKLRLNVLEPHRRLFYPDWYERSAERPTHLLLEADPPEAVTRRRLKRRQPDVIIFHSCAWDMPRINRSHYIYPHDGPERNCSAAGPTSILARVVGPGRGDGMGRHAHALARTLGAACKRRGKDLSDEQIYDGYAQQLEEALRFLRTHVSTGTTVIVRNCHGGSGGANVAERANEETQAQSMMRMNQIIARVAQQLCVPVLDVHALDEAAGFYFQEGVRADIHVPPIGALQAAFAALLAIQQVLAKTDKQPCPAR